MNKHLSTIFLIFLLAACTPTPTTIPATSISNEPVAIPATPTLQAGTPSSPTQPMEITAAAPEVSGNLWLQILSPQDEAMVNSPQVEVVGSAPAGAVVSINEEIVLVPENGQFRAMVSLEEGLNLIEIIASDTSGNETSLLLIVTYEP
jgi:hypothetical protein